MFNDSGVGINMVYCHKPRLNKLLHKATWRDQTHRWSFCILCQMSWGGTNEVLLQRHREARSSKVSGNPVDCFSHLSLTWVLPTHMSKSIYNGNLWDSQITCFRTMLFNTVVKRSITATTLLSNYHAYSKGIWRHSVLGEAESILCRTMKLKNPIVGQWQRVWKHALPGNFEF